MPAPQETDAAGTVVDAEKAVETGSNPRWFELPFFKPLRDGPDFQALLKPTEKATPTP